MTRLCSALLGSTRHSLLHIKLPRRLGEAAVGDLYERKLKSLVKCLFDVCVSCLLVLLFVLFVFEYYVSLCMVGMFWFVCVGEARDGGRW